MKQTLRPIIFLSILISVLTFLIGFKLGRRVTVAEDRIVQDKLRKLEELEKKEHEELKIAKNAAEVKDQEATRSKTDPSKNASTPSQKPSSKNRTLEKPICGVTFEYESTLSIQSETAKSLLIADAAILPSSYIYVTCEPKAATTLKSLQENKTLKPEPILFANQAALRYSQKAGIYTWAIKNGDATILFETNKENFGLLQKSVELK